MYELQVTIENDEENQGKRAATKVHYHIHSTEKGAVGPKKAKQRRYNQQNKHIQRTVSSISPSFY